MQDHEGPRRLRNSTLNHPPGKEPQVGKVLAEDIEIIGWAAEKRFFKISTPLRSS